MTSVRTPIKDLSILSRNRLLAEAERMARQLGSLEQVTSIVLRKMRYGAPDSVALRMILSAIENLESIE